MKHEERIYKCLSGNIYKIVDDPQKQKVYSWENNIIRKLDTELLTLEVAQDFINFVWYGEGRNYPPKAVLSKRNREFASATRIKIIIPKDMLYRWIILHELSHSFTSNVDGASAHHNAEFMRKYFILLEKHIKIPMPMLMYTAKQYDVKVTGYVY